MFGLLRPGSAEQTPPSPEESTPPPMSMAGPPSGQFTSREDMLAYMKEWAESQGYAIVIGRSRQNRLWLKCDRGGVYADRHGLTPENRKRKRGESRLTDCPFKVLANMRKDGIWRSHTEIADHNHEPSEDLSVHPSLRRMTDEQIRRVNEMTESGSSPAETLEELQRLWPGIKVLRRDIYNARKKYKTEKELAEAAQDLNESLPYEDPNGRIPGPTRTGRWEWLEEGDEIKRKKKKRASGVPHSSLAPELRNEGGPVAPGSTRQAPSLRSHPKPFTMARILNTEQQQAFMAQEAELENNLDPEDDYSTPNMTPPIHALSQPQARVSQSHQSNASDSRLGELPRRLSNEAFGSSLLSLQKGATNGSTIATSPGEQILMSRIERMEKEQRDTKNLLAQILSAVQGGMPVALNVVTQ